MGSREDKHAAFNEQMNAWLSKQGFWFQLRHASGDQTIVPRLIGIALRLLVLLIVCVFGLWIYLVKRVENKSFRENMRSSIELSLKGKDCQIGGFRKKGDIATLSSVTMTGTEESFFHQLSADRIRTSMTLTDGFLKSWNGRSLSIEEIDLKVKAGGSTNESAAASFQSLFVPEDGFQFSRIECEDTNITWGYSELNEGSISGSTMIAVRDGDGWILEFIGGSFSQSWLKDLRIKKMVVLCYSKGISIQETELTGKNGEGSLILNAEIGSGAKPKIKGDIKLRHIPIKALIAPAYNEWVEGNISGEGEVGGSTNSQEGVTFDIDFDLQDGDMISVRDGLPLLSALTVIDVHNSYDKVSFTQGGCEMFTGGGLFKLESLDFEAEDFLTLKGDINARPPSHIEIAQALDIKDLSKIEDVLENNFKIAIEELDTGDADQIKKPESSKDTIAEFFKKDVLAEVGIKRFFGKLELGLQPNVFAKINELSEEYPLDTETGKVWFDVPLDGTFETLTLKQAKMLYTKGRYRDN